MAVTTLEESMETSEKDENLGKVEKVEFDASEIEYVSYGDEHHLPLIMNLVFDQKKNYEPRR